MKESSPAAEPRRICWITPSSAMPAPNDTDSTMPSAVSSCSRSTVRTTSTAAMAARPPAAAPISSPGNHLPVPPSATITSHAAAMPGRVA